ncbi:MAG: DinB family protein [Chloroflexota bacterium]
MDPNRKYWNDQHKLLRQALNDPGAHATAIDLFLHQHAMVHDAELWNRGLPAFADEVWQDADEATLRCVPPKFEHSIVWLFWHIARIEDMTMNGLLAGKPQIFHRDDWLAKLNITERHSGNVVMDRAAVIAFSSAIDIHVLKSYRLMVGRATREAVMLLKPEEVRQKVKPARLQQLLDDGSVSPEAMGLIEYWGGLTLAGLLLMPPTRHCLVHLNEALKVKQKCR